MKTIAITVLLIAVACPAIAVDRIALVIGNRAYPGNEIPVAVRDMNAVSFALKGAGFTVVDAPNLTKTDFEERLSEYETSLKASPAAETLIYYSGHGVSFGSQAFLVPIDVDPGSAESFLKSAVPLQAVYDILHRTRPRLSIIMLDACRSNPFQGAAMLAGGLSKPSDEGPSGTVTVFAHTAGQAVTQSTDGVNSAFVRGIVKHIGTAGLSLNDFLIAVGDTVEEISGDRQVPWVSSSQRTPFSFRPPVYLQVSTDEVDDDLIVSAGLDTYIRTAEGREKRLRLLPGDNLVTVAVSNFRSKSSDLLPEGWRYSFELQIVPGGPRRRFRAEEPVNPVPRERWGRSFIAARLIARVEPDGVVSLRDVESAVWIDGFTLAGKGNADAILESVRWAIVRRGVELFDDGLPGVLRGLTEIKGEIVREHDAAVVEHDAAGTRAPEHGRASDLVARADDETILGAIEMVRSGVSRDDIAANLRAACAGSTRGACDAYRLNEQWAHVRAEYLFKHADDADVRFLPVILSNGELQAIYDEIFPDVIGGAP